MRTFRVSLPSMESSSLAQRGQKQTSTQRQNRSRCVCVCVVCFGTREGLVNKHQAPFDPEPLGLLFTLPHLDLNKVLLNESTVCKVRLGFGLVPIQIFHGLHFICLELNRIRLANGPKCRARQGLAFNNEIDHAR